jgi:hypothetical protein
MGLWTMRRHAFRARDLAYLGAAVCLGLCFASLGLPRPDLLGAQAEERSAPSRTIAGNAAVFSVVFSPDGRTIASGWGDHTIKLLEASSGRLLRTFPGYIGEAATIAYSPDGQTIAAGGVDGAIKVWSASNGLIVRSLGGRDPGVTSVAFSPDGRAIASSSVDRTIKLWDVASGRLVKVLQGHAASVEFAVFSPDGGAIASGSRDASVKLWDVASGRLLHTSLGHDHGVRVVAFSPDGQIVASGSGDRTIKLWEASSGRLLRTLADGGMVNSIAFSSDSHVLAAGSRDAAIRLFDVSSGRLLRTLQGHVDPVRSIALSPDGQTLASGSWDKTIKLWTVGLAPAAPAQVAEQPAAPSPSAQAAQTVAAEQAPQAAASAAPVESAPAAPRPLSTPRAAPTPQPAVAAAPAAAAPAETALASPKPIAAPAPAGRRVALIVANSAYRDAPLSNPAVDAETVRDSLLKLGFSVTVKKDLDLDGFEQAVDAFAGETRGADLALFYFAGHGFSVASDGRQQNLLMATSANLQAKTAIALQGGGEPLEHIEETIIGHARATLIFVDACRNIPTLASRGVGGRGFDRLDPASFDGAYVVLSTRVGKTAEDGESGKGSPFARAFASVLPTPGLRIEDAYARIREKVRAETLGAQVPDVIRSDLPEGGVVLMGAAGQ